MRYIGNKLNLLDFIYGAVEENKVSEGTFFDIFSGTTNVAKFFKGKGFRVISNDFMTYSFVFQKAYIENNKLPQFNDLRKVIKSPDIVKVIAYLNDLEGEEGFIYNNFCLEGTKNKKFKRNYFSSKNAKKIDKIRETMEVWKKNKLISDSEFYILLSTLLEQVPSVSNIAGTYGAFLKKDDPRKYKPLLLEVPTLIESNLEHHCYKKDANVLIREISCDILYIDPPYNNRQYATNYHMLETIAVWDKKIMGNKTGLRPYDNQHSDYCSQSKVLKSFEDLITHANCKFVLVSYNSEGLMPAKEIMKVLSKKGRVKFYTQDYRRYKSNSNGTNVKNKLKEQLFFVQVN